MRDFLDLDAPVDLRVLSLGAGVQSTTMALMCNEGLIRPPDCAIFSDTQAEPPDVYRHLDWLEKQLSFPVYRVTAGNLEEDLKAAAKGKRFASIPFYTTSEKEGGGMMRRQCTREYKTAPLEKKVRELLGMRPGQHLQKDVFMYIGISLDEIQRVRINNHARIHNKYPLISLKMTRYECIAWLKDKQYPVPPKSACYFCPFTDNARWREIKENQPEVFQKAVEIDRLIREKDMNKIKEKIYLHKSLKPLEEVDFSNAEDHGQGSLFNDECEGMCGN